MNILFGRIAEGRDTEGAFEGADNKGNTAYFDYKFNIQDEVDGTGTFSITDSCGRYVPFDFDQIDELQDILTTLKRFRDDKQDFTDHWKRIWGI